MKKLKIGVLGVSNHFVKRVLLPCKTLEHAKIHAVGSRQLQKASDLVKGFNIAKSYGSYDEVIADPDVDIIYIPLPNHLHAEWIKKAADAGKHILAEKPLCLNAEETETVVEYAQLKGIQMMEAFMYKFHPQWNFVRDQIRSNNIGKVNYIHASFSYNNPSEGNIRNIKEYGGGGLMDIGCYAISVPRFLLGIEPHQVIGQRVLHPQFGTDMLTTGILDFGDAKATFTVGTSSETFQKVDIVGTAGAITVHLPFNTYADVSAKVTVKTALGERDVMFDPVDQYGLMVDAFAKAIQKKQNPPFTADDAIYNQRIVDAIVSSSESGSWEVIV